jgi:hypothetical protein
MEANQAMTAHPAKTPPARADCPCPDGVPFDLVRDIGFSREGILKKQSRHSCAVLQTAQAWDVGPRKTSSFRGVVGMRAIRIGSMPTQNGNQDGSADDRDCR